MTSIRPPINLAALPGSARDLRASPTSAKDADPGFTALVATSRDAARDSAATPSMRPDEAALRSDLAHIFNAYGFFSADQAETPDSQAPQAPIPVADAPDGLGKERPPVARPLVRDAPAERLPDPEAAAAAQATSAAGPGQAHAMPAAAGRAANHPSDGSKPVEPFLRALENRLANEPQLPEQASSNASDKRAAHAEQRDRVTLKIAEHSVELIARLSNLSEEEKQHLLDEVDTLLAAHGLSLAGATVNGEPFSHALGRTR